MIDHVSIGVRDLAKTKRFYDAALKPLGYECLSQDAGSLGYGDDAVALWISAAERPVPPDESHICISVSRRRHAKPSMHFMPRRSRREDVIMAHPACARTMGPATMRPSWSIPMAIGSRPIAAAAADTGGSELMETRVKSPVREHYCLFETAIGPCGIAWSERGLTRLQLPESDRSATEKRLRASAVRPSEAPPAAIGPVIANIQCYMTGRSIDFAAVVIDLTGIGEFERKVCQAARAIPWGQTLSYGELARQISSPGAARAVGQALSRNPVPIIIPCHRVLAKGHRIGGFSAHGGIFAKERLLALEGVRVPAGTPLLPGIV